MTNTCHVIIIYTYDVIGRSLSASSWHKSQNNKIQRRKQASLRPDYRQQIVLTDPEHGQGQVRDSADMRSRKRTDRQTSRPTTSPHSTRRRTCPTQFVLETFHGNVSENLTQRKISSRKWVRITFWKAKESQIVSYVIFYITNGSMIHFVVTFPHVVYIRLGFIVKNDDNINWIQVSRDMFCGVNVVRNIDVLV